MIYRAIVLSVMLLTSGLAYAFAQVPAPLKSINLADALMESQGSTLQVRSMMDSSLVVRAARAVYVVDSLESLLELTPDDPLVYMFAPISSGGIRVFNIEQQLDFPTLYKQRVQLSRLKRTSAQIQYQASRREFLIEATELYIDYIFYTKMVNLLHSRLEIIDNTLAIADEDVDREQDEDLSLEIELFQHKIALLKQIKDVELQLYNAKQVLNAYFGELEISNDLAFPSKRFSGTKQEFIRAATVGDYHLSVLLTDSLIAQRQVIFSKQQWIPKLFVGYFVEQSATANDHYVIAGFTLPLWQFKGNVQAAKSNVMANNLHIAHYTQQLEIKLSTLFEQHQKYQEIAQLYQQESFKDSSQQVQQSIYKAITKRGNLGDIYALLELWYSMQSERIEANYNLAKAQNLIWIYLAD